MIRDALAVAWKEWREMPYQIGQGHARGGWFLLATYLTLFGVIYPAQLGAAYLQSQMAIVIPCFAAVFVISVAADSFAGERERHTLDSLLATRLTDRGILLGKIVAPMAFGWSCSIAQILIGWIAADIGGHQLAFYRAEIFWSAIATTFALHFLSAAIGVLLSLRAATVRQAVQSITGALFVVGAVPALISRLVPSWRSALPIDSPMILVGLLDSFLLACGFAFSMIAISRCRRDLLSLL